MKSVRLFFTVLAGLLGLLLLLTMGIYFFIRSYAGTALMSRWRHLKGIWLDHREDGKTRRQALRAVLKSDIRDSLACAWARAKKNCGLGESGK